VQKIVRPACNGRRRSYPWNHLHPSAPPQASYSCSVTEKTFSLLNLLICFPNEKIVRPSCVAACSDRGQW
jgi:hypothetical protein